MGSWGGLKRALLLFAKESQEILLGVLSYIMDTVVMQTGQIWQNAPIEHNHHDIGVVLMLSLIPPLSQVGFLKERHIKILLT